MDSCLFWYWRKWAGYRISWTLTFFVLNTWDCSSCPATESADVDLKWYIAFKKRMLKPGIYCQIIHILAEHRHKMGKIQYSVCPMCNNAEESPHPWHRQFTQLKDWNIKNCHIMITIKSYINSLCAPICPMVKSTHRSNKIEGAPVIP